MDLYFHLKPNGFAPGYFSEYIAKVADFAEGICGQCRASCPGFTVARSVNRGSANGGPVIMWYDYQEDLIMRVVNCDDHAEIERVLAFVELNFTITERWVNHATIASSKRKKWLTRAAPTEYIRTTSGTPLQHWLF